MNRGTQPTFRIVPAWLDLGCDLAHGRDCEAHHSATAETRATIGAMQLLRIISGPKTACTHIPDPLATPAADRCEECGSRFNLRMCATCGHVGCCESQAGHARRHALGEHHPVIVSMPVDQGFTWCYEEKAYVS